MSDEPLFADEELWSAIRKLPRRQMDVVLLLWFEDLSVAEVAATIDCGHETVRTHWRRARKALVARLSGTPKVGTDPHTRPDQPDHGGAEP